MRVAVEFRSIFLKPVPRKPSSAIRDNMANKDDYLTTYREFFERFAQTVNPNDQLPVKLASYKLLNVEVIGAIIDWTTQYLTQKYV